MADELKAHLSEDEDLERAKKFWNENGKSITAGIILGLLAIGGYNGWQTWQKSQGENASMLYANLTDPALPEQSAAALASDLMDDYSGTPYAAHGALFMAKQEIEAGNPEAAGRYLRFVIDDTDDQGVRHVARIRLGMVLLSEGDPDGVLALLGGVGEDEGQEFVSRYEELRGDAYFLKDDKDAARAAWERSQQAMNPGSASAGIIKMKLDGLGAL